MIYLYCHSLFANGYPMNSIVYSLSSSEVVAVIVNSSSATCVRFSGTNYTFSSEPDATNVVIVY